MNSMSIKEILDKETDTEVQLSGWITTSRRSKKISFINLNDGSTINGIQIILKSDLKNYLKISKLQIHSALTINGIIKYNQKDKKNEINTSNVEIISEAIEEYPLQKKTQSFEFLREYQELRPNTKTFNAIFKIRTCLTEIIHDFFQKEKFLYIHTPILTSIDAEGMGEVFNVTTNEKNAFFKKNIFLGVTGQLYAEAFAQSFKNVYTFGPTFRADNSNTTRHAAEFWMIEPEIAFSHLEDLMIFAEKLLKYVAKNILIKCKDEIEFCCNNFEKNLLNRINSITNKKFQKISYTEAIEIIKKHKNRFVNKDVKWGIELYTEYEKFLAEEIFKGPIFVYDYPKDFKAFYMKLNSDKKTVRAIDLLVEDIGEILGGSERENNYQILKKKMENQNISDEKLKWYLDLRKYGYAPSSGFGIGFERLVMYFTGTKNIKDVSLFPRSHNYLKV